MVESGRNLAGEPRDRVRFDGAEVVVLPAPGLDPAALRRRGALTRVWLIAGALAAARDLTLAYTAQRVQFGRPIDRFQAVQHHLVALAQQAALARMAAELAARAVSASGSAGGWSGVDDVAVAAIVASAAAAEGARVAHQAHGAMGLTREYPLQLLTRRLWAWRGEYLSTRDNARRLGRRIVEVGPDQLYPAITAGWEQP